MSQIIQGSSLFAAAAADPTQYVLFLDDFHANSSLGQGSSASARAFFDRSWAGFLTGGRGSILSVRPADAGTHGDVALTTGTTLNDAGLLFQSDNGAQATWTPLNNSVFDLRMRFKLNQSTLCTVLVGFFDALNTANQICIEYDTTLGDTNFMAVCRNAGTATRTALAAVDTNYHTFRIRAVTPGTILFSIDGGAEISIATNVPTVTMSPVIEIFTRTTAAKVLTADFYFLVIAISR